MPEISVPSQWLKADSVSDGDKIKFLDEGEFKPSTYKDQNGNIKMNFNIGVEFKGETKRATINVTSQKFLIPVYGANTADWIGKEAILFKSISAQGKPMLLMKPVD
jgi:hypothetical protein